jgi:hypothetical protein
MPVRTALLSTISRLAVYAAALIVLATARLPQPRIDTTTSTARTAAPATPAANAAWRLALAGILLTGVVLDIHRRRQVWH